VRTSISRYKIYCMTFFFTMVKVLLPILLFLHQLIAPTTPPLPLLQVGRSATRRRSGIPRSTGTSREPSPQRYGATPLRTVPPPSSRPPSRPPIKPLMTEKILRQSQEAETALADALVSCPTLCTAAPLFSHHAYTWPAQHCHVLEAFG
jgi:hypothetical protein